MTKHVIACCQTTRIYMHENQRESSMQAENTSDQHKIRSFIERHCDSVEHEG